MALLENEAYGRVSTRESVSVMLIRVTILQKTQAIKKLHYKKRNGATIVGYVQESNCGWRDIGTYLGGCVTVQHKEETTIRKRIPV